MLASGSAERSGLNSRCPQHLVCRLILHGTCRTPRLGNWTLHQGVGPEGAWEQEQDSLHVQTQRQAGRCQIINLTGSPSKTLLQEDWKLVNKVDTKAQYELRGPVQEQGRRLRVRWEHKWLLARLFIYLFVFMGFESEARGSRMKLANITRC